MTCCRPNRAAGKSSGPSFDKEANANRPGKSGAAGARILGGDWRPRHKILSHEELAQVLGVGPRTVRLAVADLRRRGYLRTVPGRGTYVLPEEWPS